MDRKGVRMKNILSYQASEYDCGPTTVMNAFRYLFDREAIVPEIIKTISLYTLDVYDNEGNEGQSGTSLMAMMFLSNWFNQFGTTKKFPIQTEILVDEQVYIHKNSRIVECLQQGGAVILLVWLGETKHYILLTDMEDDYVYVFDPYEWDVEEDGPFDGINIIPVENQPKKMNRKVKMDLINLDTEDLYNMGAVTGREAMLLYNTDTRNTPEKSIEYFI